MQYYKLYGNVYVETGEDGWLHLCRQQDDVIPLCGDTGAGTLWRYLDPIMYTENPVRGIQYVVYVPVRLVCPSCLACESAFEVSQFGGVITQEVGSLDVMQSIVSMLQQHECYPFDEDNGYEGRDMLDTVAEAVLRVLRGGYTMESIFDGTIGKYLCGLDNASEEVVP